VQFIIGNHHSHHYQHHQPTDAVLLDKRPLVAVASKFDKL